jgi:hypothetical protein
LDYLCYNWRQEGEFNLSCGKRISDEIKFRSEKGKKNLKKFTRFFHFSSFKFFK